jgi:cyclin H
MTSNVVPEDLRYLASSQYRLWSFTPTDLQALRTTTNQFAADRVREAVRRAREKARALSSADVSDADTKGKSTGASALPDGEVDCLTVEEELKLITYFCRQTLQLGDHLVFPTDVKASLL